MGTEARHCESCYDCSADFFLFLQSAIMFTRSRVSVCVNGIQGGYINSGDSASILASITIFLRVEGSCVL